MIGVSDIEIYRDGGSIQFRISGCDVDGLYQLPTGALGVPQPLFREGVPLSFGSKDEFRVLSVLESWLEDSISPSDKEAMAELATRPWHNLPERLSSVVPFVYIRGVADVLRERTEPESQDLHGKNESITMGLDMTYQALPADCGLIERARGDVKLGEMFCQIPNWYRNGYLLRPGQWPEAEALWRELGELAKLHPGLETRNCNLDRWWDMLHFLLSAKRRGDAGSQVDEWFDKAIRGSEAIAAHVQGTQGCPIRFVRPTEVDVIATLLSAVTLEELRRCYSPERMEAEGVYKFFADEQEWDWHHLPQCFEAFRRFYMDAAGRGECVLVCLD